MRSKLTILHVIRSPVGGVFRHVSDLATAQSEAGHEVGLVCGLEDCGPHQEGRIAELARKLPLGVVRFPMGRSIGPGDVSSSLRVARYVAKVRPEIIHAHGAKGGVFGRAAASMQRRRGDVVAAFYAPHGGSMHYDPRSLQGRVYFTVERLLERITDGIIHVSAYEADVYRRKVGAPRCPAHVVRNGLRPEEFQPVERAEDAADFLFIGELRELKGVDVFIEALAQLEREGLAARGLVVGPAAAGEADRWRDLANAKVSLNRVVFHPPMPAREAFALARHVVLPSRAESMPYVVLEAAACGTPVIATNVGGLPEIFAGETERLVTPGEPQALAASMRAALEEPERLASEAMLRRRRVEQNFSLAAAVARIEGIYRDALEARYSIIRAHPVAEADLSR